MVASEKFWNNVAEKYAKSPVRDMEAYEATLDRVRAHISSDANVLEVGCGTGTTALNLAGDVGRLTASDISSKMIEIAEEKRNAAGADNVSFIRATLDNHDFERASYDTVLAFNFLHLAPDMTAAISEIHRLVKPGGLFISKTVCLKEWKPFASVMLHLLPLMRLVGKAPDIVRKLNAEELDGAITAAGFEIIERDYLPKKARNRFIVARKPV
ncbi:MAG: class I SAM-dependent methyltransferase [Marinicaulis sp.]|nr:class I SAM-dependent methyltransferase [Marinicaulis sp.]